MQNLNKNQSILAIIFVILAAFSRFLPHPSNFTPFIAMAIFSGYHFSNKINALLITLATLFASDLIVNNVLYADYNGGKFVFFYEGALWVYGSIALIVLLSGGLLKKINPQNLLPMSLGSSVLFFILSNFGTWLSTNMYPKTAAGLGLCYTAAIPFFTNSLIGDLIYTAILFGLYAVVAKKLEFQKG